MSPALQAALAALEHGDLPREPSGDGLRAAQLMRGMSRAVEDRIPGSLNRRLSAMRQGRT